MKIKTILQPRAGGYVALYIPAEIQQKLGLEAKQEVIIENIKEGFKILKKGENIK